MNKKKEIEEEHVITEREKRAWAKSKERKSRREPPKLDRLQHPAADRLLRIQT